MSRPTREQIDAAIKWSESARGAGGPVEALAEIMLALADDLKAARDCGQDDVCKLTPGCQRHWEERNRELVLERDVAQAENERLRLADFDGLNKQRAELIEELSHERADNDAMAALLGHCETCACAAPSWTDAARAVLAARAKRMGETRGKR